VWYLNIYFLTYLLSLRRVRRWVNTVLSLFNDVRTSPSLMLDTPSASHAVWSRHGLLYQRRQVHRDRSVALHNILPQCQKFWAVAEIYPLEGDNIFDRGLFIVHSILTPNRKWSVSCHHLIHGGLIKIERFLTSKLFSISVQLRLKYRQNNIRCTSLSLHSAKHQQWARADALPPDRQSTGDKVPHPFRPSVPRL